MPKLSHKYFDEIIQFVQLYFPLYSHREIDETPLIKTSRHHIFFSADGVIKIDGYDLGSKTIEPSIWVTESTKSIMDGRGATICGLIGDRLLDRENILRVVNTNNDANKVGLSPVRSKMNLFDRIEKDGTFDLATGQRVEIAYGYQVAFENRISHYNDETFEAFCYVLQAVSGSNKWIGVYQGKKEISFTFENFDQAIRIAKAFNQEAIWDNRSGLPIMVSYEEVRRSVK